MWACEFCTFLNVGVAADAPRCDCCGKSRVVRQKLTAVGRNVAPGAQAGGAAAAVAPPKAPRGRAADSGGRAELVFAATGATGSQSGKELSRVGGSGGSAVAGSKRKRSPSTASSSDSSDGSSDDTALLPQSSPRGGKRKGGGLRRPVAKRARPASSSSSSSTSSSDGSSSDSGGTVLHSSGSEDSSCSSSSSNDSSDSDFDVRRPKAKASAKPAPAAAARGGAVILLSSSSDEEEEEDEAIVSVSRVKDAGSSKVGKGRSLLPQPLPAPRGSSGPPPAAAAAAKAAAAAPPPKAVKAGSSAREQQPEMGAPSRRSQPFFQQLPGLPPPPVRPAPAPAPAPVKKRASAAQVPPPQQLPSYPAGVPWYLAHAPTSLEDVLKALHKDKVTTTAALLSAMVGGEDAGALSSSLPPPKLLILLGPPGTGKSALVQCLARINGWGLREVAEHTALRAPSIAAAGAGGSGGRGGADAEEEDGEGGGARFRRGGSSSGPSLSVSTFCSFLLGTTTYKALQLTSGAAGASSSRSGGEAAAPRAPLGLGPCFPQPVSAAPTLFPVDAPSSSSASPALLLLEELPRLEATEGGASWIRDTDPDVAALRDAFTAFLQHGRTPAVLVVSEGPGAGEAPSKPALARLLGPALLEHPQVALVAFPPVPDTRMRKTLLAVAQARGVRYDPAPASSVSSSGGYLVPYPLPDLVSGIVATARGDLRHALVSLEFACTRPEMLRRVAAASSSSNSNNNNSSGGFSPELPLERRPRDVNADAGERFNWGGDDGSGSASAGAAVLCGRDDFFDSIHVLGKLIYAKRETAAEALAGGGAASSASASASEGVSDPRGSLQYDPDSLMATAAYDAGTVGAFILENGMTAFTDVGQLARAWDGLSFADTLLARGSGSGGGLAPRPRARLTRYPTAIAGGSTYNLGTGLSTETSAASIISRLVSTHNTCPAPSTFRALRRPVSFAVARIATSNWRWMVEGGLGAGPDLQYATAAAPAVGAAAAASAAAATVGVPLRSGLSPTERAIDVVPALGLMLKTASNAPRGPAPTAPGASAGMPLSRRAAALVSAACTFGTGDAAVIDNDSGAVTSLIGQPALKVWGARAMGAGSSFPRRGERDGGGGELLEAADLGAGGDRGASDDEDGDARVSRGSASLAGMVVGAWEARAAKGGVDVSAEAAAALVSAPPPQAPPRPGGAALAPPPHDWEMRIEDPDAPAPLRRGPVFAPPRR